MLLDLEETRTRLVVDLQGRVGDPEALANEIRRLLADPETCEKMAAAAHERYVANFSTVPLSRLLDEQLRLAYSRR